MAAWNGGRTRGEAGGAARTAQGGDGLAAAVGGEGLAVGDDTLTTGDASLRIVDRGPVTFVRGSATVSSTAASQDGGEPSARANTHAEVAGADFVFTFSTDTSDAGTGESGSWETASSSTRLFAVDIEGVDFGGQQTVEIGVARGGGGDPRSWFSGNLSTGSASADVSGDDGYSLARTGTFTTDTASAVAVDAYGLIA